MTGSDVSAWQQFLTAQNAFRDTVDGVYGPLTVQGTIAYQTAKGLTADGIVGTGTYSRAVLDGFQAAPGRVTAPGMDAMLDCAPFASGIASAGMKFVARYYSKFPQKIMTRQEALALSTAGLQMVAVYQDSSNAIQFFSTQLGNQCATRALQIAAGIGQPAGSAIYFATDFDPTSDQVTGPISDYFRAIAQVFAVAPTRYAVGVYGSGLTCRIIRDSSLATFTWLSQSTGFTESLEFRPQAHLVQVFPSRNICNGQLSIDDDIAQADNFGAFTVAP
jgi:peptidoglycan hydrolase-like protein with peptidoglycan-binding domain